MVFVQLDGRTHDGVTQLRNPPALLLPLTLFELSEAFSSPAV